MPPKKTKSVAKKESVKRIPRRKQKGGAFHTVEDMVREVNDLTPTENNKLKVVIYSTSAPPSAPSADEFDNLTNFLLFMSSLNINKTPDDATFQSQLITFFQKRSSVYGSAYLMFLDDILQCSKIIHNISNYQVIIGIDNDKPEPTYAIIINEITKDGKKHRGLITKCFEGLGD